MAVATHRPAPVGTTPPAPARAVLWTGLVANMLIVEATFLFSAGDSSPLLSVAKFLGLHAALIMMVQLLLVARLPWLDRRIGMDRLTRWHRWTGFLLLWTVVGHGTFIVLGFARLDGRSAAGTFLDLANVFASLIGICAAAVIVAVAAMSVRAVRRRLPYEVWHGIHLTLYAALLLGVYHQLLEGTTFTASPLIEAYWWTMWSLVVLALIAGRVVLPIWRNVYHQFRVAAVVPESDNVVSVHVTGRHLDRLPARAGQFFIWRFLGHNHWWQANPFSLSAAPNGRSLRLTVKAAGTTSARLRHVSVGTRVFAEGPYGAFTSLHRSRPGMLLIAGGVGITPIRALLEESAGPVVVLYRVSAAADAVLLDELHALTRHRGARLHLVTGRTGTGTPPSAPFAPENLLALVPDLGDRDVFVCGPPAMTAAVLNSLRVLGVPRRQTHAERFGLG